MHYWTLSAAIGAAILSSASPAQSVASGIYHLDQERSDNAFQTIDSATAELPTAQRSLARMRPRKSVAVGQIRVSLAGRLLGIGYDAKAPIIVRIGEEPIKWTLIEGLVFNVSAEADGDAVIVKFNGDDNERTIVYRSLGRDLVENTTIISTFLSTPIRFTRAYSRTN